MPDTKPIDDVAPIDRLMTRADPEPLPTPLDPAGPESRGGDADPKTAPKPGQGDPNAKPAPTDISRTA
jgi:hypothetical protein